MSKNNPLHSNRRTTRIIVTTAILTAMSVVLMYLEFAVPFMPPFLKFDFSEIPVLIGSFALGPVHGIIIELLKNLIHLPFTATGGIGELSNFITGSFYVVSAGLWYSGHRTRKGAVGSLLIGAGVLALIACPFNYFVTIPLYGTVLGFPLEAIIAMCQGVNPLIDSKLSLILIGFLPFNLMKGIAIGFITFFVYKPISKLIGRTREATES